MPCQTPVQHTIAAGDSLYRLAITYHTTAQSILRENPHITPYNLRIGQQIAICPGPTYPVPAPYEGPPQSPGSDGGITQAEMALSNDMRRLWQEHVMWTRMLILTMADKLGGEDTATKRLLENPGDLGRVFGRYFGGAAGKAVSDLLTEHLVVGKELIKATVDKNTMAAADANRRWYQNADAIAKAMASLSSHYDQQELQSMLYRHLDLTKQEVGMRLAQNYPADADVYDMISQQANEMADYFTNGIVKQFPRQFQ